MASTCVQRQPALSDRVHAILSESSRQIIFSVNRLIPTADERTGYSCLSVLLRDDSVNEAQLRLARRPAKLRTLSCQEAVALSDDSTSCPRKVCYQHLTGLCVYRADKFIIDTPRKQCTEAQPWKTYVLHIAASTWMRRRSQESLLL